MSEILKCHGDAVDACFEIGSAAKDGVRPLDLDAYSTLGLVKNPSW